jgi:hypothetical protein
MRGMQVFQDKEEVQMERLADVGIEEEEEEGNHLRKELVSYRVDDKEFVLYPVNEIYMLVLL